MTSGRTLLALGALGAAFAASGCGSRGVQVSQSDSTHKGAELFASHCSGCHTLDVAGTIGGATKVRDRERVDGPNFNVRPETRDQVLYAIRNGGFSGAIMPENIVVGQDAQAVAAFLAKYAGRLKPKSVVVSTDNPQAGS
jgi:mono/diheme cytochrome c family protein